LAEDLIGPRSKNEEILARPSDVYLTGILWPQQISMAGEDDERLGIAGSDSVDDPDGESDAVNTGSIQKPSVAGISFSVASKNEPYVTVTCSFATYELKKEKWARQNHEVIFSTLALTVGLPKLIRLKEVRDEVPDVSLSIRCIEIDSGLIVTLTLVNTLQAELNRNSIEACCLFQTKIHVEPHKETILIPKPPRRSDSMSEESEDMVSDEQSGSLLYRKVAEFAVGHVCSAEWELSENQASGIPTAKWVATTWLPSSIVEGVDPNGHVFFSELRNNKDTFDPMSAELLATADRENLKASLQSFCNAYKRWLNLQMIRISDPSDVSQKLTHVAKAHLERCQDALDRMSASVDQICDDDKLRRSFQLANYAMHIQHSWDKSKSSHGALRWRPFQLGFLLLSTPSTLERDHSHRGVMDLLWFPTGGGKTEAYLGLIACIAVYRRLSDNPDDQEGVSAVMRYTLRLLTTQQFARSAAMVLALEAIRTGKISVPEGMSLKGGQPFSIGLWVGGDATPNRRADAFSSLNGSSDVASPKQLARCSACGGRLNWSMQSPSSPVNVECINNSCVLCGPLPIHTVDDDVYEYRPTLLIGTVDKFAQIVRQKNTNKLFAISTGSPPDLIIQDELHLISGPLGTVTGTYEAALDLMFAARGYKTKIIGSTATIRRAPEQVLALFDREAFQFPPPAIDHNDSGFAVKDNREEATGRRYLGVTTAGRSAKFTLQAVAGSLLQTAAGAFDDNLRKDAYWTLVGYFNSLRELGGALVLMQDDVTDSIELYAESRSEEPRPLTNVEELTSRRTQEEIREMLDLLDIKVGDSGAVDAVLATNMVSVGVDISRLGLMLVNGQPKTIAEYIQSTSRVGRGSVSGMVVSVLNNAKARDRSHFETFCSWHQTLYRDVEATSVTPFASRARDRSLHAALVAAIRHLVPNMLDSPAIDDDAEDLALEIIDKIVERASRIDPEESSIRYELENGRRGLHKWISRSPEVYWIDFKGKKSLLQSAEQAAARKATGRAIGAAWPTLNSMRTVEAGTLFRMAPSLRSKEIKDEE
jgi:hypothetical protein